jgi:protein-arginine kinase activator protein McsA
MYYLLTGISILIGFSAGMVFENRRLKIKSKKILQEHLKDLDKLIAKINRHNESKVEVDNDHQIQLIEYSLNQALSEERYEDAAQLRDILENLKKQK